MAPQHSRSAARFMMAPAVVLLLGWMLVPLLMTLYFSFKTYLPLRGGDLGWTGFDNYVRFVSSSAFWPPRRGSLRRRRRPRSRHPRPTRRRVTQAPGSTSPP